MNIICFGDSNTWGRIPHGGRYNFTDTYSGVLQLHLGSNYKIIQEGLSGRLSNIEDPERAGTNGLEAINSIISNIQDVKAISIMIGTGEFKNRLNRTPENILNGILEIYNSVLQKIPEATIILICPANIKDWVKDEVIRSSYVGASKLSKDFRALFVDYCIANEISYIDVNNLGEASNLDGRHLDLEVHNVLGVELANVLKKLL